MNYKSANWLAAGEAWSRILEMLMPITTSLAEFFGSGFKK